MKKFLIGLGIGLCALNIPAANAAGGMDELSALLEKHPYEVGYYAKNLKTGRVVERLAERPVCLASMVKVFCLTELYRQKHERGLDLAQTIEVSPHGLITLTRAAALMIGVSDNPCTHALADFLGRDKVNAIPVLLGISTMSPDILPTPERLHSTLDLRIAGGRVAAPALPMHGTARGVAAYYELLQRRAVISREISEELLDFFASHPMPFSDKFNQEYKFAGKGGNILWTRPPNHFSCMGWGIFGASASQEPVVLCVWGEWFPQDMPPDKQSEFLKRVTDGVIKKLNRPE